MNIHSNSIQSQEMGIDTDEIMEIMLDHMLVKLSREAVCQAIEASQTYTNMLIALSKLMKLAPDQIGAIEALASMDRLIAVARKLQNV